MSSRTESFTVEKSLPSERLDTFLRRQFPAVSRVALQRLIEAGHIRVNGRTVKPTHAPRAGEAIEIHWPEATPATAQPEDIPFDVLFEDRSLLVLNKPAGLVVHPAAGHEEHTLVNALLHHCVAKNDETHVALSAQFAGRKVKKIYNAIVCGEPAREAGEIHAAIARHPSHRKRMAVRDDHSGRAAHTSWHVLKRLNAATLVAAQIHTGRTHQIRVHFQFLGHPLAGDATYGARQNRRLTELTGYEPPRVMLHARELSFIHPRTGKLMSFEAPLPKDFQKALKSLTVR